MPTVRFCRFDNRVWVDLRCHGVTNEHACLLQSAPRALACMISRRKNAGAGRLDRVRETLRDSSIFVLATVLLAWAALARDLVVRIFFAHGMTAELCVSVLLLAGRWISFHWRALRCQCGLQPRLSGAFDGVQLGTRLSRHDPLRCLWRAFRPSRCVGGSGVRLGCLRNAGIDHSLPLRVWPTGQHRQSARQRHSDTLRRRPWPCVLAPARAEYAIKQRRYLDGMTNRRQDADSSDRPGASIV